MKKVLIVLLSVVFVLSLFVGCAKVMTDEEILQRAEELEAENANQSETTNTPEPTEEPIEEPEPIILDSLENIEEIDFSVPSIWRKEKAKDGFYYYPYDDSTTLLYANYSSTDHFLDYDITDRDTMTEIFDGVITGIEGSSDSYNEQSREIKTFENGSYYLILNYRCIFFEKEYELLCCTFFTSTHSYSIAFGQPSNISKSFRETYERIVDSLQINNPEPTPTTTVNPASTSTENPTPTSTENPTPTSTENPTPATSETVSQRNALSTAKDYLKYMAFSREGLIDQLEYEGFSKEDATYGVDNCGADWMEQAVKCAKNYLDNMAFSSNGLIDQLEYEGFTKEEATYGVDNCGADWMEQAVKCAKNYLDSMDFSRDGLIKQLEYEGFTHSQAVYGVEVNGL